MHDQIEDIKKRGINYSQLLETYVVFTKRNSLSKLLFKWIFFCVTMLVFVLIVCLFGFSNVKVLLVFSRIEDFNQITVEMVLGFFTAILPATASLIVAFIKIPQIIAEYLFDTHEDDNMSAVIKHIQDYDTDMFEMEYKVKYLISLNKSQTVDTMDESLGEIEISDGKQIRLG